MKKLLVAAATAGLLSASFLVAHPAMAQTPQDCVPGGTNHNGPVQGSTGAGQNAPPGGSTCEALVQPNGTVTLQNGPAVNDPGSNTAPREGQGGGGTGGKG